jgi:hypothetical protein
VAHTCNPSYSGGRDQENQGSKQIIQKKSLKKGWQSGSSGRERTTTVHCEKCGMTACLEQHLVSMMLWTRDGEH